MARPPWRSGKSSSKCPPDNPPHNHTAPLAPHSRRPASRPGAVFMPAGLSPGLYAPFCMPHTRRFERKHLRSLDASSPRSFTCPLLHGLTLETALTRSLSNLRRLLRRLPIRPVAQTDGSFGQASLQGPETSGNVLNRSLRCFLPRAAFEPGEGAYRLVNSSNTNICLCRPPCAYVCKPQVVLHNLVHPMSGRIVLF